MPKLIVVRPTGEETILDARPGQSAMQVMKKNGIEEILAICGGICCCGTCHVLVDPAFIDRLQAPDRQERELLARKGGRRNSRLSCQIPMTEGLDGLRVTPVPEED